MGNDFNFVGHWSLRSVLSKIILLLDMFTFSTAWLGIFVFQNILILIAFSVFSVYFCRGFLYHLISGTVNLLQLFIVYR